MAEFVEQRMEEMVPIFEKIRQTSLIPDPELKEVIGEMREHEMKIQRPARTLDDYFHYFAFLKTFLDALKESRESLNYHHHTNEIEDRLKSIIASRFGSANINFKHDIRFWQFRLTFMKDLNCLSHVSNLFTDVTRVLGSKYPELWIDASRFEWTRYPGTTKGITSARQFVQLGLRRHSDCLDLFLQGFALELQYVEFVRENQQEKEKVLELENGEAILFDLSLAKSFYKQAQKMCIKEGPKLYHAFYSKAKGFSFTKSLCDQILENLQSDFSSDETAYDILAKIALSEGNGKLFSSHIEKCIQKYEDGLLLKPTVKMYDLYIDMLMFITDHIPHPNKYDYEVMLLHLFEKANERWKLSEQNYVKWFELVKSIENEDRENKPSLSSSSDDILEIGFSKFPNNSHLLHEKIIQSMSEEGSGAFSIVKKYQSNLNKSKDDTSKIWLGLFINLTLQPHVESEECENLFRSAPRDVKGKLAILFIKYFSSIDMSIARKFYDDNFTQPNLSNDFHLEMAKLEETTLSDLENKETILSRISQCYENATEYFGINCIEPWLASIKFERERHNLTKASTIYNRALKRIHPDLKEELLLAERSLKTSRN